MAEVEEQFRTFKAKVGEYIITKTGENELIISFKTENHILHYYVRPMNIDGKVLIAPMGSDELKEFTGLQSFIQELKGEHVKTKQKNIVMIRALPVLPGLAIHQARRTQAVRDGEALKLQEPVPGIKVHK